MKPLLIINFKTYREGTGVHAIQLAKKIEKFKKKANIILAVDVLDLPSLTKSINLRIISQHIDPVTYGSHTGKIVPEEIRAEGAYGTLINHAEDRISLLQIKKTIQRAKEAKLKTIVCSSSLKQIQEIISLKPYAIAFEVPSLIGTGKSIAKYKPTSIIHFVKLLKKTKIIPLCGAGISTKEDVQHALHLGTKGVLIASAIVEAKDPEKKLRELLS